MKNFDAEIKLIEAKLAICIISLNSVKPSFPLILIITNYSHYSSLSPSRSVSRGALSKQYSLPASARNTRYMPRHRHSFRHDRPQYQHHEHAFDHPHVRTHSASLHAPHDHRPHVSRELHSPRHESPHRPRELHSPRLESPHLPRELHSPRVETPVVASVVVDEPQDQPT